MNRVRKYMWFLIKESFHGYFVPIVGAYKGIKHEYRVLERNHKRFLKEFHGVSDANE